MAGINTITGKGVAEPPMKFYIALEFYNEHQGNTYVRTFPNGGRADPDNAEDKTMEAVPQAWPEVFELIDRYIEKYPGHIPISVKDCCVASKVQFGTDKFLPDAQQKLFLHQRYGITDQGRPQQTVPQLAGGQPQIDPSMINLLAQNNMMPTINPQQEQSLLRRPSADMGVNQNPKAAELLSKLQGLSTNPGGG